MGTLYVVGTPIGNLDDLTARAGRVLAGAAVVAAEDTRVSRRLLAHLGVAVGVGTDGVRLVSCNEHNWRRRVPELLAALADGGDVALVTDAGAPGVSDPGAGVVSAVAAAGYGVVSVPGVSAVTAALSVSGFAADRFRFLGFLPRRRAERVAVLSEAADGGETLVVFEAPHRVRGTLGDLAEVVGDAPLAVCRELTKWHEEVWRGTALGALDYFVEPRGEFTIVVDGGGAQSARASGAQSGAGAASGEPYIAINAARAALLERRAAGMSGRDAVLEVTAGTGLARRAVYRLWVELDAAGSGVG